MVSLLCEDICRAYTYCGKLQIPCLQSGIFAGHLQAQEGGVFWGRARSIDK